MEPVFKPRSRGRSRHGLRCGSREGPRAAHYAAEKAAVLRMTIWRGPEPVIVRRARSAQRSRLDSPSAPNRKHAYFGLW